jgi:hypothetical protein
MPDSIPPEITVTEEAGGICYRFSPRPLGASRWLGLAGVVLGLVLCAVPVWATGTVIRIIVQQESAGSGLSWLLFTIFTLLLAPLGFKMAIIGLFILAGHSEIELRHGMLSARECCGPLRWVWQRSTADLRRFLVSESLGPEQGPDPRGMLAALLLNVLLSWSVGLGVIVPQWKPAVAGSRARPLFLAPGYPRAWLLAVADDLARRCASSVEPAPSPEAPAPSEAICTPAPAFPISPTIPAQPLTRLDPVKAPAPPRIPVVEQNADLSEFEEVDEQPTGSLIAVDTSAGNQTIIVPPLGWQANRGWLAGAIIMCLFALVLTPTLFGGFASALGMVGAVLCVLAAWAGGIALLVVAFNRAHRRVVFDVTGETLVIWQTGLFRVQPLRWSRQQLADVFVMHHVDSEGPDHWELQIHPQPGQGRRLRLLAYRDQAELRWLATVLRRTLRCPGTSPDSPPPGFVVRSPSLAARWHKRRSTT